MKARISMLGIQAFAAQVNKERAEQIILPASLAEFVELFACSKPAPLYKIQQFLSHAWQLHHSAIQHLFVCLQKGQQPEVVKNLADYPSDSF
jgi:hypothetical protein